MPLTNQTSAPEAPVRSAADELNSTKVDPPEELSWLKPSSSSSENPPVLDVKRAMEIALQNSPILSAAKAQVEEKLQNKNLALSPLLPQIHFGPSYDQRSETQSLVTAGINPQRRTALDSNVSVVLFNDRLIGNLCSAGFDYKAQKYIYDGVRLQTMQDAALAFYSYQQASATYAIQLDNLRFTQAILKQVGDRNKAGVAGNEDLYRWEAQQASGKTSVLNAYVLMANALVDLNQTLGVDTFINWTIKKPALTKENYFFLDPDMLEFFHDNRRNISTRFALFFALSHTPGLQAVDESIESRKVQLGAAKRSIFMPDIEANGGYDFIMSESAITLAGKSRHDNEWNVFVTANFPLYEGGKPVSETKLNEAMLNELWSNRKNLCNQVESLTAQSLQAMQGSYPGIKYTHIEVEKTKASMDIFVNKYSEGSITLETLIGAESSTVQAQLDEAQATYAFLKNLARFQLALGWFEAFESPEEKQKFVHAIEFYRQAQKNSMLQQEVQVQPFAPVKSETENKKTVAPAPLINH